MNERHVSWRKWCSLVDDRYVVVVSVGWRGTAEREREAGGEVERQRARYGEVLIDSEEQIACPGAWLPLSEDVCGIEQGPVLLT